MTATPDRVVIELVKMDAAIKTVNGIAPNALLFAKMGGTGGTTIKSSKGPKRDKQYNKDDRKENDQQNWFHCQKRGHITKNCIRKQHGNPHVATDADYICSADFNRNIWTAGSSDARSSDWFIDCVCMTHISGHRSICVTYTNYPANIKMVKGQNGVIFFACRYWGVRVISQQLDGMIGIDHSSRCGEFAGIVHRHLTVSALGQRCHSLTG